MSAIKTTDIACDTKDCLYWTHGDTGYRPQIAVARARAKAEGWTTGRDEYGITDYCPQCSGTGYWLDMGDAGVGGYFVLHDDD